MTRISNNSIGIGIIGAGFMGQTYARTVIDHVNGAHLVAVAEGSRAPGLAKEYGIRVHDSFEALAADSEVDAVLVATPHAQHGGHALAAAREGKHVLIDKPMATTVEACDAILDACEKQNLVCTLMYTQRVRIGPRTAKELVDSGELGRVLHIHSIQVVPEGMESAVPGWQLQPENVGILLGHGIHNIDHARWITGQEISTVFAKVRNLGKPYPVDGTTDLVLTMADGTVCTVFCSFETIKPGFPNTGGASQIVCEHGLLDVDWYGELKVSVRGGPWEVRAAQEPVDWAGKGFLDPVRLKAYAANVQAFVDAIRDGSLLIATGWDGRQAVAAALAAYESSRSGREVSL